MQLFILKNSIYYKNLVFPGDKKLGYARIVKKHLYEATKDRFN